MFLRAYSKSFLKQMESFYILKLSLRVLVHGLSFTRHLQGFFAYFKRMNNFTDHMHSRNLLAQNTLAVFAVISLILLCTL